MGTDSLDTAYDDAFHTMMLKCDDLVFPLLNFMFGEHYTGQEQIIRTSNEEYIDNGGGDETKRITDSQFTVVSSWQRKRYHIECESSTKAEVILVRMFEYGAQIALDGAELVDGVMKLRVQFPHAGILFLRNPENVPGQMLIEIVTPSGSSCSYPVQVIKESDFTLDQIFDNGLYLLLPFYLFNYEKHLPKLNKDESELLALIAEYRKIADTVDELVESGRLSARSRYVIMSMIKRVSEKLAMKYINVKEKVGDFMGGRVVELDIFKAEDAAKKQGISQGISRGADMFAALIKKLTPGTEEYEFALNATDEQRQELYKKYNIAG